MAVLGHVVVRRVGEAEVYAATADLHERFAPGYAGWGHPPSEDEVRATSAGWGAPNADREGRFGPTTVRWYPTVQWFDGAGFADLLRSTSLYRRLDEAVREPLLDAVAERIRRRAVRPGPAALPQRPARRSAMRLSAHRHLRRRAPARLHYRAADAGAVVPTRVQTSTAAGGRTVVPGGATVADATPVVVCIGVHVLDVLGGPVDEMPAPGRAQLVDEIAISVAGTAGGVAVDLARHGIATATIGVVGDDVAGRLLRGVMAGHGIDVAGLRATTELQTSMSMHAIGRDGERRPIHVVGANRLLGVEDAAPVAASGARAVHLGGLDVLPGLWSAAPGLLASWRAAGAVTSLDLLGGRAADAGVDWGAVLPEVDWFLPNDTQLRQLSGAADILAALGVGAGPGRPPRPS